jgi:phage replication initiation protein
MGLVACGGLSQRGRVYVSLSGAGCDIVGVAGLTWLTKNFEVLKVNLTRVDIALDDFEGKNTIQSTLRRYKKGEFSNRKAAAKFQYIQKGDNDRSGETIYIGARKSGKLCRIYEKGRQLGDPDSKWLRVEMQFGSHQRKLPVQMLLDPLPYAISAYPAISKMFRGNVLPCTIRTIRVTSKISVKRVLANMRKNVGPAFNTLLEAGVTPGNLLTILNKVGSNVPKRLLLQGVAESIKLIGLDSPSLKTSPSYYSMGELTAELDSMVSTVSIDDEALCFTNPDILFRRDNVTVTSQDGGRGLK